MYKLSAYLGHKIATGTYCNPAFRITIHISVSSEQIRCLLQNCHQHGGQVVCEPWASSWSSVVADPGVPGSELPSPPSVFCAASCRFHSSTRRRSSRSRTMCASRMAAWQCRRWAGFRCVGEAALRIPTASRSMPSSGAKATAGTPRSATHFHCPLGSTTATPLVLTAMPVRSPNAMAKPTACPMFLDWRSSAGDTGGRCAEGGGVPDAASARDEG